MKKENTHIGKYLFRRIKLIGESTVSKDNTISSQRANIDFLNEKSDEYDTVCKTLKAGNVGYASDNFKASESVIVVNRSKTDRKFTLTAIWQDSGKVSVAYSGDSATLSFDNDVWTTSAEMTVNPRKEGVTIATFSNNVDSNTFKVIIIVTD